MTASPRDFDVAPAVMPAIYDNRFYDGADWDKTTIHASQQTYLTATGPMQVSWCAEQYANLLRNEFSTYTVPEQAMQQARDRELMEKLEIMASLIAQPPPSLYLQMSRPADWTWHINVDSPKIAGFDCWYDPIECELTGGVRPGDRGGIAKAERAKVKPAAAVSGNTFNAPPDPGAGLLTMAAQTHKLGGWGL